MRSTPRIAAVLMVVAVVLANVAFLGLGSVFNYPDILQESAEEILAELRVPRAMLPGKDALALGDVGLVR